MRVLVVDDDHDVRRVVRRGLEREQFDVVEAADGDAALRRAAELPIDVAVLDLHLPGMSGLDVLARLRERRPALYVVMLTGAGSEADRVLGLVSGADDYIVKPFSARELAARLVAVRRRESRARPVVVDIGGLRINMAAREATIGGEPVDLTRREFDLLSYLVANPRRTFTRAELLDAVWGSSAEWQSAKTVTEHVRRVRAKVELDPANPVRIVSVPGYGYRFDPDGPPTATQPGRAPSTHDESSGDATIILAGTTILHASPAAVALLQADSDGEVVGRDFLEFVAAESLGAVRAREETVRRGRSPRPEVIRLVRFDGEAVPVELTTMPMLWKSEHATQVTMWDVTGDSSKMQELAIGIRSDIAEAVVIADAQLRIVSFNPAAEELYGWREAEAIGRSTKEVMPWLRDDTAAAEARGAFQRDGRWHGVVVQRRRDGTTVTVRSSSTMLRDSARRPVGVVSVNRPIDPASGHPVVDRSSVDAALDADIRRGIEHGEFTVYYQPVASLEDGTWTGVEALVRWRHPERGLLAPGAFIDVAERSGAIVELGHSVLDEACRQASAWQRGGHDLHVSVNLSTRQLADPALFERVTESLDRSSLPANKLWLEITETALVEDLDQAAEVLNRITELGVCLSIDDFGTGWSSLTYLRSFPIGSLKIDRVFVEGLGTESADAAIVTSILSLGQELDLFVIAEGVETNSQRSHLVNLGCGWAQGYLFGRPEAPHRLPLTTNG